MSVLEYSDYKQKGKYKWDDWAQLVQWQLATAIQKHGFYFVHEKEKPVATEFDQDIAGMASEMRAEGVSLRLFKQCAQPGLDVARRHASGEKR